ncbi:TetR/AcrR family transcriptional regulator [Sphingomonas sp.]|uniref:TetR/AcrR family transcriptional regulator n=1 Tax=Sphingomonas sp. TaxID=28214 RepID=UPI002CAF4FFD|nr:TetR/AcrR family transcriptional regulator [Sphingomonas sp.]HTG38667.1 TetR/AcrR family transcriptional regulator [Sphingomonas sp.]
MRAKTGPGRPRDPAKLDAILVAARESFLERGFHASTIEDIAARAGVSKVTLYNRFGDKESLFEAMVRREVSRMDALFTPPADGARSLKDRLTQIGTALLELMFDPEHVAFDRLIAGEIAQSPALARRFFDAAPGQCRGALAQIVTDAAEAGQLSVDDAGRAAEDLVALWKGFCDFELKLGLIERPSDEAIVARAARGTAVFLRAYAPDNVAAAGEGQ